MYRCWLECTTWVPRETREGIISLELELQMVENGPVCRHWELNLVPLRKWAVLLTTEPCLWPPSFYSLCPKLLPPLPLLPFLSLSLPLFLPLPLQFYSNPLYAIGERKSLQQSVYFDCWDTNFCFALWSAIWVVKRGCDQSELKMSPRFLIFLADKRDKARPLQWEGRDETEACRCWLWRRNHSGLLPRVCCLGSSCCPDIYVQRTISFLPVPPLAAIPDTDCSWLHWHLSTTCGCGRKKPVCGNSECRRAEN